MDTQSVCGRAAHMVPRVSHCEGVVRHASCLLAFSSPSASPFHLPPTPCPLLLWRCIQSLLWVQTPQENEGEEKDEVGDEDDDLVERTASSRGLNVVKVVSLSVRLQTHPANHHKDVTQEKAGSNAVGNVPRNRCIRPVMTNDTHDTCRVLRLLERPVNVCRLQISNVSHECLIQNPGISAALGDCFNWHVERKSWYPNFERPGCASGSAEWRLEPSRSPGIINARAT